jgi:hypothetical protein
VLEVGNRSSSLPASRMAKRGLSCLKPLKNNERLQRQVTRVNSGGYELTEVGVDYSLSQISRTTDVVLDRSPPKPADES